MTEFEYAAVFYGIVVGLAVQNIFTSIHKLVEAVGGPMVLTRDQRLLQRPEINSCSRLVSESSLAVLQSSHSPSLPVA